MKNIVYLFAIVILFASCKKTPTPAPAVPVLASITTTAASAITSTTATSGGNISSDGGANITARGVCWNSSAGPTVANSKTTDGTGTGSFASSVTGLTAGTTYYARAYATNSAGTAYGNEITFSAGTGLATITTTAASAITATMATSGGNITSDGGAAITERGICLNTSTNPTTSNTKVVSGSGIGSFVSNMTGLVPGTAYYVRAYAINNIGTVYGNEITITTGATLPTIITTAISAITQTTATSGGNITSDGGAAITVRGVCWNTSTGPTIANSKTTDGTGTGSFASSVTGLTAGTIYYIRAYATNSAGTAYGNELSFTTTSSIPSVTICTQVWMLNNLAVTTYRNGDPIPQVTDPAAWVALTTGAWCYYNNDPAMGAIYGKLYNWHAVNDPRGLAPTGWHVPTDAEFVTLSTCLGGFTGAGGKMKEIGTTHWLTPNTGATNSSGFTGLPGGVRAENGGPFVGIGEEGRWWSATGTGGGGGSAIGYSLIYNSSNFFYFGNWSHVGYSVRCIKD
ncbi:MAG: fibrobacter succinogenes major paralogous domain-containing protein [Ferruginibacter sp.]